MTLMAPAPLEAGVRAMVLRRFPAAEVTVVSIPEKAASLEALVAGYKAVRARKPDLALVSLAPDFLTFSDEEAFIRQSAWMVNWAIPFGGVAWTAVGVDPALVYPGLTRQQREGSELLREIVRGHDLDWIARPAGAPVTLQAALEQWFDAQVGKAL